MSSFILSAAPASSFHTLFLFISLPCARFPTGRIPESQLKILVPIFEVPILRNKEKAVQRSMDHQQQSDLPETVACYSETDSRRHSTIQNSILPTDSMVTVRLSGSPLPLPSNQDVDSHKESFAKAFVVQNSSSIKTSCNVNDDIELAVAPTHVEEEHTPEEQRGSVATMPITPGEDIVTSSASTVRSRSDSSGTFSSTDSAQVDWDELEKSEEQAPRDEGSDEVNPR